MLLICDYFRHILSDVSFEVAFSCVLETLGKFIPEYSVASFPGLRRGGKGGGGGKGRAGSETKYSVIPFLPS